MRTLLQIALGLGLLSTPAFAGDKAPPKADATKTDAKAPATDAKAPKADAKAPATDAKAPKADAKPAADMKK